MISAIQACSSSCHLTDYWPASWLRLGKRRRSAITFSAMASSVVCQHCRGVRAVQEPGWIAALLHLAAFIKRVPATGDFNQLRRLAGIMPPRRPRRHRRRLPDFPSLHPKKLCEPPALADGDEIEPCRRTARIQFRLDNEILQNAFRSNTRRIAGASPWRTRGAEPHSFHEKEAYGRSERETTRGSHDRLNGQPQERQHSAAEGGTRDRLPPASDSRATSQRMLSILYL
jgi:hypothetical protein